jgi:hypothetical protein
MVMEYVLKNVTAHVMMKKQMKNLKYVLVVIETIMDYVYLMILVVSQLNVKILNIVEIMKDSGY